jgi:hypothetical protein
MPPFLERVWFDNATKNCYALAIHLKQKDATREDPH